MRTRPSEDDLSTFEGWLRYQAVDIATTPPGEFGCQSPQASSSSPRTEPDPA